MEGHWFGVPGLEPLVPGFGAYGLNNMLAMVGTLMIVEFTLVMGE